MKNVKPGEPSADDGTGGPGTRGTAVYPESEEKQQRIAEETLLHLLYEERFREACMAVRNLDSRSREFVERITPILEGPEDSRPIHERVLQHANRSMQFQEGMMLYAKRRTSFLEQGSREREILSEIGSVLVLCRHRNDLIRRLLMVSLGQCFSRDRNLTNPPGLVEHPGTRDGV